MSAMLRAALLTLSLIATPKRDYYAPQEGFGSYPYLNRGSFSELNAKPLSTMGDDVLRVTSAPVLAGRGYILELKPLPRTEHSVAARGELIFIERHSRKPWGHGLGTTPWRRSGSMPLFVYEEEWRVFIARVDALLAQHQGNDPDPPSSENGLVYLRVCTDGDGHAVERRTRKGERWMAEACVDHDPSSEIKTMTEALIMDRFCDVVGDSQACRARHGRGLP